MKTLLSRVEKESVNYATAEHAAIDHLKMASSHTFDSRTNLFSHITYTLCYRYVKLNGYDR